jgi:hypothetical protein
VNHERPERRLVNRRLSMTKVMGVLASLGLVTLMACSATPDDAGDRAVVPSVQSINVQPKSEDAKKCIWEAGGGEPHPGYCSDHEDEASCLDMCGCGWHNAEMN